MQRRTLVVGLAVVAGIWWFRGGDAPAPAPAPHPRQQAGVLSDGFLALTPPRDVHDGRHVVEYDREGKRVESRPLRLDSADAAPDDVTARPWKRKKPRKPRP